MIAQQPDQNKPAKEATDSKTFEPDKPQVEPGSNNPMGKFNKALRKILSVPKKRNKKEISLTGSLSCIIIKVT
jgi:hypothetical protein